MVAKPLCPLYKNIIKPLDWARYPELRYDWACDIDFEPNRKYLMLASGSIQNMNWKQILYKVKNIIFNFITANAYKLPLFVGKIVTIGFDDGDLVRIQ